VSRRPTVVEVARRAGVSIASVSRVLNGIPARPETEQRVRSAVAELGYVPDATGRSLKRGRTLQIAFAVDALDNPVYAEMMRGVEAGLGGSGARLLVSSTGHDPADLLALVDSLSRGYADGLIISPLRRTPELTAALVGAPVPVVVIGDLGNAPLDTVRTDSRVGVRLAYEHLRSTGRSRVAFVNGPPDTAPGRARDQGFRTASAGDAAGPMVEVDDFTVAAGEQAWTRLRAGGGTFDAVLAANDLLALGVMRGALNDGVDIPEQVAVTGIDDIAFARIFAPALTSVSLGAYERGGLAARLLLDRMASPASPLQTRTVEPTLVVRASTGARDG
jgi:LacI family transcriptional regulator